MHGSKASTCTLSGVAGELHRPCAVPTCLSQSGGLGGGDGPLGVWGVALHSTAAPRHDSARACGKGESTPQHTPSHHNTLLTTLQTPQQPTIAPNTAVAGALPGDHPRTYQARCRCIAGLDLDHPRPLVQHRHTSALHQTGHHASSRHRHRPLPRPPHRGTPAGQPAGRAGHPVRPGPAPAWAPGPHPPPAKWTKKGRSTGDQPELNERSMRGSCCKWKTRLLG
jgi:hypothetical protein